MGQVFYKNLLVLKCLLIILSYVANLDTLKAFSREGTVKYDNKR